MLLTSTAYGVRVGLEVEPDLESELRVCLPFWWADSDDAPDRVWPIGPGDGIQRTVRDLELWVAEHAQDRVFVHAAAVAVDGSALLLPGRSGAGKTTLTAALLAAGADYLSDEYAVLDASGRVHPYPRPLSVRSGATRDAVPAGHYGARTVTGPIPVGAIAVLAHTPGTTWEPRRLSPSAAVLRLLDNTVSARRAAASALAATTAAVGVARTVEGVRGEAADVVPALLALLRPGPAKG